MMKKLGERGLMKGVLLFFVLVAIIFVGISFGKPYYRYYTLGAHTRDFLKTEIGDIEKIKQNVMKDAAELNVPLDEKNLAVVKVDKIIKVKATWSDTVNFWDYYKKKFDFEMAEEY